MNAETYLFIAAIAAAWIAHSAFRPFANCWLCGGRPKHESNRGGSWRLCVACKGRGSRVRWGRRVYERINPRATRK